MEKMDEKEKELLEKCSIKTKEQFIAKCKEAGIVDDWYSFVLDRNKPVSMDEDTVYYRISGKTIVWFPFQKWDIAYDKLLRYKKEYEWELTGAPYRITSVNFEANANITTHFGNTMTIHEYRFSKEVEQEMLDDGWVYDHYDQYMCYSVYHKTVTTSSIIRNSSIVFRFMKRTDRRDADTFGFLEDEYLCGAYRYPVPKDLWSSLKSERDFPVFISSELSKVLTERLTKNLIDDEFEDLRAFKEAHWRALLDAYNPKLSADDQKVAFAKASNNAEINHPAVDNYEESRSNKAIHNNLHKAYDLAELEWKNKKID